MSRLRPAGAALLALPLALLLFAALSPAAAQAETRVEQVRVHRAPDHVRVVLDLSGPVTWNLFTLDSPDRVVVDVPAVEFVGEMPDAALADTPVTAMRTGPRGTGIRLVLDLQRQLAPNAFALRPVGPYGHRLVLDLYEPSQDSLVAPAPAPAPEPVAPAREAAPRNLVVAIDAGHGGEDPGALGPDGILEKDVVLALALQLKTLLDAEHGFEAVLVRTGDYYVARRQRPHLARNQRADIFVSIHADAFKSPDARGASVYALSRKGATSETARWLAAGQDRSDLIGGVRPLSLGDKDDAVAGVLLDLSMNRTLDDSLTLGDQVLRELGAVTRLHSSKVHQAHFTVLTSPDIPSILVESGYITNPREARKLATAGYRNTLARALLAGIRSWAQGAAPRGTIIAQQARQPFDYTIRQGDTLSGIAERFRVSQRQLQQANKLAGSSIRAGQVIRIPAS